MYISSWKVLSSLFVCNETDDRYYNKSEKMSADFF